MLDQSLIVQYLPVLIFFIIAVLVSSLMLFANMAIGHGESDVEKLSPYECGFETFSDSRAAFDVRFYLVTLLFIIFDLEVAFLFPWAITLGHLGALGFWSMFIFLGVLTVGFIYEWNKGALEWE